MILGQGFSPEETRAIASLLDHSGYRSILTRLQAFIDDLTDDLTQEKDAEKSIIILRRWQVAKEFLHILSTTPERFRAELAEERQGVALRDEEDIDLPPTKEQLIERMKAIMQAKQNLMQAGF